MRYRLLISVLVAGLLVIALGASAQGGAPVIVDGDDWSLPAWVEAASGSGFFSEQAAPDYAVDTRVVDVTWRQLNPAQGVFSTTTEGGAQGMEFPSLDQQLADDSPFWMRIWASGVDWAPEWVATDCGLTRSWPDYDDQSHLPIWDECMWNHLMQLYRELFIVRGLRSDPRLKLVYVPGAFTWCEFDFEIIEEAANDGLTLEVFDAWFHTAMSDLVTIFDGDNSDPTDDYSNKLVFTGEDYPWGPWDEGDDGFAFDAVTAGLGIRTGITELFNFHLSHIPSYGTTINDEGHMVTDDSWPLLDGMRVVGAENECYNHCGYATSDTYYAVKMSNLKALQMRVNWLYVVPTDSYMIEYPDHWRWVRLSLGRRAETAPDAWVALREAEDRYWIDDDSHSWQGKPWVRNLERWLVQRDVGPDGMSRRGSTVFSGEVDADNGTSYEGRRTDLATGQDSFYFFVDDAFLSGAAPPFEVKVTYLDSGSATWYVEYVNAAGRRPTEAVTNSGSDEMRTATWTVNDAVFAGHFISGADLRIYNSGGQDLELLFVRLVKLDPAQPLRRRVRRGAGRLAP